MTVLWIIIGVESIEGASVSSRRFEILDARISRQVIGISDFKPVSVNGGHILNPFSSSVEYSIDGEEEDGIGGDEGSGAGKIDSDNGTSIDDAAVVDGDISDGMSIKSKLSSGCSPSVVVTYIIRYVFFILNHIFIFL